MEDELSEVLGVSSAVSRSSLIVSRLGVQLLANQDCTLRGVRS